jgi:hypothetical protein
LTKNSTICQKEGTQLKDYDGDGILDTFVTKDGKVYSFNGLIPKDTDYPLRR